MALGIYVHIPYCLQRCVYCDFATFETGDSRIGPPEEYVDLVCREIQTRHSGVLSKIKQVDTIYFGGGTPSLLEPKHILAIKNCLSQCGFQFSGNLEWTIEINPATIDAHKLNSYLEMGINRFSVGVQSFAESQLKRAGRKHNVEQTRETLRLLAGLNYSMDLLFALPHQSKDDLKFDLEEFLRWKPAHISPYCLTVPTSNPMAKNRPEDDTQVEMFEMIREHLGGAGYSQYEISNYALPGFESRHNQLYWEDENYWGIGLSSHSYLKDGDFGVRFWNPSQYNSYKEQVGMTSEKPYDLLPSNQREYLKFNEALTDFCHTALRTKTGLDSEALEGKFSRKGRDWVEKQLLALPNSWIERQNGLWSLTKEGQVLSNKIFEKIYMGPADL
jgi:oxygen-independent coproporphyrinogen III oxidase